MGGFLRDEEKRGIIFDFLAMLLLLFGGFFVNRYIRIDGLYMDDLYMWSCYGEQSFLEFVFPIGVSTRFRPVYWMATYLEMMIVRNHPSLFVTINIILNVLISFYIYFFALRLSRRNRPIAMVSGAMYLISHFAYYQIAQALGLLETLSLFLAILLLHILYDYIMDGGYKRFLTANLVYFLLCFCHERYIALLPLFFISLYFRGKCEGKRDGKAMDDHQFSNDEHNQILNSHASQVWLNNEQKSGNGTFIVNENRQKFIKWLYRWRKWFIPVINIILIILIRRAAIGKAFPAGTGGTEVTETFSITQSFKFTLQQLMYIFGINVGPEYLSGISWSDISPDIKRYVYLSWIPLILIFISYLRYSISAGKWKESRFLGHNLLFLSFLALCIGCSSVTIRLEMRWIYVSYAGALLYLSFMAGESCVLIGKWLSGKRYSEAENAGADEATERKVIQIAARREKRAYALRIEKRISFVFSFLFIFYALCLIPVEKYERSHYDKIYFWENQDRMNSLARETVLSYGVEGVLGKQVYILENKYEMSDFYARTFFKVYDPGPERNAKGTRINFLNSWEELPEGSSMKNSILLEEVPEERGYRDVTEEKM